MCIYMYIERDVSREMYIICIHIYVYRERDVYIFVCISIYV